MKAGAFSLLLPPLLLLLLWPVLGQANPLRVDQWDKKLPGTYWYVPTAGLPATLHVSATSQIFNIEQQTVYYIESCENGVLNGWLVNQWSGEGQGTSLTCSNMTGTISPKGDIAIAMIANGAYSTPWPKATVMRKAGKLRTLVQATIPISKTETFVVHGPTYMTAIDYKDKEWDDLPGNPGSLPSFVAECDHIIV